MVPGRRYDLSDIPPILARRLPIGLAAFVAGAAVVAGVAIVSASYRTRAENARRASQPAATAEPAPGPGSATLVARNKLRALESDLAAGERDLEAAQARLQSVRALAVAVTRAGAGSPELAAAQSRLSAVDARLSEDRAALDRLRRVAVAQAVPPPPPSPELQFALGEMAKAKAVLAELQDRLTPQHPDVLAQQADVAELQESINRLTPAPEVPKENPASGAEMAGLTDAIAAAERERGELVARIDTLQRMAPVSRPDQSELNEASRELESLHGVRASRLGSLTVVRQELAEALAHDKAIAASAAERRAVAVAPLVTDAGAAVRGVWPWALLAGLLSALAAGLLVEVRDDRIRDAADLKATSPLPQLGSISEIVPLTSAPPPAERELSTLPEPSSTTLIWHPRCPARTIEQYRHVAHAVRRFRAERQARVIGVTSALPGEGKTLSSVNLAVSLAESYRQRVILIDADLRRPTVHQRFDLPGRDGLTEWLRRDDAPERVMVRLSSRLSVVPAGHPELNPVPLLTSLRMAMLLAAARADFDWVIVDTPPAGLITDAGVLEGSLDGFVVIVAAGRTPSALLRQAIGRLGPDRVLGLILNRSRRARGPEGETYAPYHLGGRRPA